MPLIERKPTVPSQAPLNIPVVQPVVHQTAVYEESIKPFNSMIAYVEGAPWTVDYYSQVVGKHSELKAIDTMASGVHQSYTRVQDMELRVTSPLSDSYDQETATMKTTGTAHLYGGVVPNIEDHFITESADKHLTIFKVTDVETATASSSTVYEINYMVIGSIEDVPDIYNSLTSKVAKDYHFLKNRIMEGNSPLVVEEDYNKLLNLKQAYRTLLEYLMTVFYSKGNKMMCLPGQTKSIYDYNTIEFLFKIVDPTEHNNMLGVVRAPNAASIYADQSNIYDVLIERNYHMLDQCNALFGLIKADAAGKNVFIAGTSFYDIDYVVYPKNPDVTATHKGTRPIMLSDWKIETTSRKGISFPEPENDRVAIPNGNVPLIFNVHQNGYYVFSKDFYEGGSDISGLEILVRDYLKNKTLDLNILNKLLISFKSMLRMDQFYYGPILLLLIKEASRKVYSQ